MSKKFTHIENEKLLKAEIEARQKALNHTFSKGSVYMIIDNNYGAHSRIENTMVGTTWSNNCYFRYVGKQGIHHCFQEINGGWSRTYTDPQLIGKKIKEVH